MKTAYEMLLKAHLNNFLSDFGFEERVSVNYNEKDVCRLANITHSLSLRAVSDRDNLQVITSCALLWELMDPSWKYLPVFISQILMNIGFIPSAKMVNKDNESDKLISSGSIFDDFEYTREINNTTIETEFGAKLVLSGFQYRLWKGIFEKKFVGVSAPTSAGKSYVLSNAVVDNVYINGGVALYIVPTISLINQVYRDIKSILASNSLKDIRLLKGTSFIGTSDNKKEIYILTQERAMAVLQESPKKLDNLTMFVVDEVQNIEKISNEKEERSKILFDVIESINELSPQCAVLSGPRIKNISELVERWYPGKGIPISDEVPPVVNFCYSFSKSTNKGYVRLTQHSPLSDRTTVLVKDDLNFSKIIGKKQYRGEDVYKILHKFSTTKDKSGNIIFAKSSPNATKTAEEISKLVSSDYHNDEINGLIAYIKNDIHSKYALASTLRKRVAFHHGKVPEHIRILLEKYFSNGSIRTLVCTTTLMQGVNFPTRNIIVRNPDLARTESLSGYDFSNLKGRAGRLHKDFVGRTIILDEEAFESSDVQLGMFEDKQVKFSYEERFRESRDIVEKSIADDTCVNVECKDMLTKIRFTAVKFGKEGLRRLKRVGIDIDGKMYNDVLEKVAQLKFPKDIAIKNPYWDPVDLNQIYSHYTSGIAPRVATSPYLLDSYILHLLEYFYKFHNYYFEKYVAIYDGLFKPVSIMAKEWAIGTSLSSIIDPPTWRIKKPEDIDNRISFVNNTIRFGIVKIMRPLVMMDDPESWIPGAIEYGAIHPEHKNLIEKGVPREIAIKIPHLIADQVSTTDLLQASYLNSYEKMVIAEVL